MSLVRALVVLLLVAAAGTACFAGENKKSKSKIKPYALIFGTVFDPDGRTVYGVKLKIRPADEKKARWEQYSNHSGEFAQRVPAGKRNYIVWADIKDYKLPSGKHLRGGPEVTVGIEYDERADISVHLIW